MTQSKPVPNAWRPLATACLAATLLIGPTTGQSCEPPAGMLSWWPADGTAQDIVGAKNGQLSGGATYAPGMVGQAFRFDGVDDAISLGNPATFDFTPTSSFTIEAWINAAGTNFTGVEGAQFIVALNYQCSPTHQSLILSKTGIVTFAIRDANGVSAYAASPSAIPWNTFHHIAGVREVSGSVKTLRLYIDGTEVASVPDKTAGTLASSATDYIGRRYPCANTSTYSGLIDELGIYARALSATEIQAIYSAGSAGKCALANYRIYSNDTGGGLSGFDAAAGAPPIGISFDNIAVGQDIGNTIVSGIQFVHSAEGAPLLVVRGDSTGTPGGFKNAPMRTTNRLYPTSGSRILSPGGTVLGPGPKDEVENDDLELVFVNPVSAFGFDLLTQSADGDSRTHIDVFDQADKPIFSGTVPISNLGVGRAPGRSDFWGIVTKNTTLIGRIVIDETESDNVCPDSNVGYDTFRFRP